MAIIKKFRITNFKTKKELIRLNKISVFFGKRKIFEDLTVKDEGEKAASVSPAILNYLTMFDFLQGNQFSDMGFSNKPIERPNDLRNINKLMKKELGYSYINSIII